MCACVCKKERKGTFVQASGFMSEQTYSIEASVALFSSAAAMALAPTLPMLFPESLLQHIREMRMEQA